MEFTQIKIIKIEIYPKECGICMILATLNNDHINQYVVNILSYVLNGMI